MNLRLLLRPASVSFLTTAVMTLGVVGCPDPDATYQRFLDDTKADRVGAGEAIVGEGIRDIGDATFFLTIRPTVFAANPLIFRATTTALEYTGDGGALVSLAIDPLVADVPQAQGCEEPRTPAPSHPLDTDGNATIYVNDVVISPDGEFTIAFGEQLVHGCANAISGSDILATLTLTGITRSKDRFCGTMDGALIRPYSLALEGTFAFVRYEGEAVPPAAQLPPDSDCAVETGGGGTGGGGGSGGEEGGA